MKTGLTVSRGSPRFWDSWEGGGHGLSLASRARCRGLDVQRGHAALSHGPKHCNVRVELHLSLHSATAVETGYRDARAWGHGRGDAWGAVGVRASTAGASAWASHVQPRPLCTQVLLRFHAQHEHFR